MGSSSHTRRQDIIRAAFFLQEDQPSTEPPHFAWEKRCAKNRLKEATAWNSYAPRLRRFHLHCSHLSMSPQHPAHLLILDSTYTKQTALHMGMQVFMGMATFPVSPAGRSIWKYFETFLKYFEILRIL